MGRTGPANLATGLDPDSQVFYVWAFAFDANRYGLVHVL